MKTVFTYCRICETRCGIAVDVEDNRVVEVRPDRDNVHNWRDFCIKGKTAPELVEHPQRILAPMKRVGDGYVEVSWEQAVREIGASLNTIIGRDGSDAVGMYRGNPMYYTFSHLTFGQAFMDAIKSHSLYTVGSVDQNPEMLVMEQMYGSPVTAMVPDVDECDCFLFIGMNPAESRFNWMGSAPDGWFRVKQRQKAGADLIVVDPRRTPTAQQADLHVSIRPGGDWAFVLAVIKVIIDRGWTHGEDCAKANGYEVVADLARSANLCELASRCDISVETIEDVAERFATARTSMAVAHTGVSMTTTGTVGLWLVHVLNLICGRLDRPGGRRPEPGFCPLPKMIQLTTKKKLPPSRVNGRARVLGELPLAELPNEILTPGPGRLRALILAAGNPVVAGPDGNRLAEALADLELLIAVDLVQRESHRDADWLIPGQHWLERDEMHLFFGTLEERPFIQYGFGAVDAPAGVKSEWEFYTDLALEMRRPLFGVPGMNRIIKASRALARATRRPHLAFNHHWVPWAMLRAGRKLKWREVKKHEHGWLYEEKSFGHLSKALLTKDKRVHAAPPPFVGELRRLLSVPAPQPDPTYPLTMIGRRRLKSMNSFINELPSTYPKHRFNEVQMHPDDAAAADLSPGDRARVSSPLGFIELPVIISDSVRPGVVSVPHGWGSRIFDPRGGGAPRVYGANRNLLTNTDDLVPLSHMPPVNTTAVAVTKAATARK
ncbi:MAG: molybdopterin-dependent oxidoreductase [Propionibacteriales bacterium]|nr:molybdopterin-dependent oxidoreductase [Propionibacteriales bacterium]